MDYLTDNDMLRASMIVLTLFWGIATIGLLWMYPASNPFLVAISVGYLLVYMGISLYRTWVPLPSLVLATE
jgi:phosphatidylcholine synthase